MRAKYFHVLFSALALCLVLAPVGSVRAAWVSGLNGGYIGGKRNLTDFPAVTNIYKNLHAAMVFWGGGRDSTEIWDNQRTWVYWGQIYSDGSPFYLGSRVWDSTLVRIDGKTVLDDPDFTVFAASEKLCLPAGWHDIEIRFGHEGGRGGALFYTKEGQLCSFGISRGEVAPTSMVECSCMSEPGDMSLFRCNDESPVGSRLSIMVTPQGLPVDCEPPVGGTNGLSCGDSFKCSALPEFVDAGLHYKNLGYVKKDLADGKWINVTTNAGVSAFNYVHNEYSSLIEWLYENDGVFLDSAPINCRDGGSVVSDRKSEIGLNSWGRGSKIKLTATPAEGYFFRRWYGDIPEKIAHDTTVTIVMDKPKACHPMFSRCWKYDSDVITDGNWILNAIDSETGIIVTGVKSVVDQSILDLSTPVTDAAGNSREIVSIGKAAFSGNNSLVHVFLPDTLTSVGDNAFSGNLSLTSVEPFLPDSVVSIGDSAFCNCPALKGDLALRGLTDLSDNAFAFCNAITSAELKKVKNIGGYAFYACSAMKSVALSKTLESIGSNAFGFCSSLAEADPFLPNSVMFIGASAFNGCKALSGDLRLKNSALKTIPAWAFACCAEIKSANLKGVSDSIGDYAFYGCTALRKVVLPDTLKSTGNSAFRECPALKKK